MKKLWSDLELVEISCDSKNVTWKLKYRYVSISWRFSYPDVGIRTTEESSRIATLSRSSKQSSFVPKLQGMSISIASRDLLSKMRSNKQFIMEKGSIHNNNMTETILTLVDTSDLFFVFLKVTLALIVQILFLYQYRLIFFIKSINSPHDSLDIVRRGEVLDSLITGKSGFLHRILLKICKTTLYLSITLLSITSSSLIWPRIYKVCSIICNMLNINLNFTWRYVIIVIFTNLIVGVILTKVTKLIFSNS